jgi:hypothetical protein
VKTQVVGMFATEEAPARAGTPATAELTTTALTQRTPMAAKGQYREMIFLPFHSLKEVDIGSKIFSLD